MFFGWGFFLISSGSPHAPRAHMGVHRTCGEPDEIGLAAMGVKLNGSGRVPRWVVQPEHDVRNGCALGLPGLPRLDDAYRQSQVHTGQA